MVAVRRYPERLLEGSAEIVRAETDQLRERSERDLLDEMFLDVCNDRAPLPGRGAALLDILQAGHAGVETSELVRQDAAECFEVGAATGRATLDQALQL